MRTFNPYFFNQAFVPGHSAVAMRAQMFYAGIFVLTARAGGKTTKKNKLNL